MKKFFILLLTAIVLATVGCSSSEEEIPDINSSPKNANSINYSQAETEYSDGRKFIDKYEYYEGYDIPGIYPKSLIYEWETEDGDKGTKYFLYTEPVFSKITIKGEDGPGFTVDGYTILEIRFDSPDKEYDGSILATKNTCFFLNGIEETVEYNEYRISCSKEAFNYWYNNCFCLNDIDSIDQIGDNIFALSNEYYGESLCDEGGNISYKITSCESYRGTIGHMHRYSYKYLYDKYGKVAAIYENHTASGHVDINLYYYDQYGRLSECISFWVTEEPENIDTLVFELLGGNTKYEDWKESITTYKY